MQRIVGSRVSKIEETLGILKTGVMSNRYREKLKTRVEEDLAALRKAVSEGSEASEVLFSRIDKLERRLRRIPIARDSLQLEGYSATKRNAFEKVPDLIHECSTDHAAAAKLVSQIVSGFASERPVFQEPSNPLAVNVRAAAQCSRKCSRFVQFPGDTH